MEVRARNERIRQLVNRQGGRVTRAQLRQLGLSNGAVTSWVATGRLIRVLPHVYAVGHTAASDHADVWAAVLYAGPAAMLSHASAAYQLHLIEYPPRVIHASTPRAKVRSFADRIVVHTERELQRVTDGQGIPTTTVPQTLLDLGAVRDGLKLVRHALAVLDYRHELEFDALNAACGRGRRGSATLHAALATHDPRLAHTKSSLEEEFLALCARWRLPPPLVNQVIYGEEVDAYWPERRLVVELDGAANHSSPAQRRRDHVRDVTLRAHGIVVVRYDWALIRQRRRTVRAELTRYLVSSG